MKNIAFLIQPTHTLLLVYVMKYTIKAHHKTGREGNGNNTSSRVTRENLKYWALWCTLSIVLTTNEYKKIFPFQNFLRKLVNLGHTAGKSVTMVLEQQTWLWWWCKNWYLFSCTVTTWETHKNKPANTGKVLLLRGTDTTGMAAGRANILYTSCANCWTQNIMLAH